ncbi:hypothetical protein GS4_14_01490 [Gordonia soli NBRC 108243]|uniref:Uncharacterized protein n=1 Tax=Gordonia soli NBRC 108243 TaxID=1223545 RepID=M0QJ55_9ACTN|nr:hypothetical protein GS4_14_01490 [Gordonia soli NBRC 108243]
MIMAFDKPPPTPTSPVIDAPPAATQSDSIDELVAAYGELDAVLDRIAQLSAAHQQSPPPRPCARKRRPCVSGRSLAGPWSLWRTMNEFERTMNDFGRTVDESGRTVDVDVEVPIPHCGVSPASTRAMR